MKHRSRVDRSHLKRPKSSPGKLLDAVARQGAELSPSPSDRSPVGGDLAQDTTSLNPRKRQLDTTDRVNTSPVKRARSTRTRAQQLGVRDGDREQVNKTTLQPIPDPHKCPPALSLELKTEGAERVSPATQLRKRQISSDAEDNERRLTRARLTRKNLALFEKMARKKGPNTASASAPPDSTNGSLTTKTTSTTMSGFAIQARKNGILDPLHSKPPTNIKAIREQHARSRRTASPPESAYKNYVNNVGKAPNEATIVFEVGAQLLKRYDNKGYNQVFNQAFTAFPKNVGFNNGLSAPQPDFIEGLEMEEYLPFPVDEHVSGAVLYEDNPNSLTLPHLAGEWKKKARLQSRYDGAALVYARNKALSLIGKRDPPGHAEVRTFTTDGTNLNFFAHYTAPSKDGALEYHQYQYASTNVKDSYQGHKDGRTGLRNEQDHAREQSYTLRDQLKEYWKQRGSALQPIAEGAMPVPDEELLNTTNAYENDEAGCELVEPPYQLTHEKEEGAQGTGVPC
ncbi:hypothetical protein GGS24DRAFT_437800 [Hypoxylon argillaceum]|nr:hypothetical protein GGS24DRAFT_437800 [Hypoxylon argillaceum]